MSEKFKKEKIENDFEQVAREIVKKLKNNYLNASVVIAILRRKFGKVQAKREEFAEGRDHLTVSGNFQSDKYSWCGVGFVPLKLTDPAARDLLAEYAKRRKVIDIEFPRDLNEALEFIPEKPNDNYESFETVQGLKIKLEKVREALRNFDANAAIREALDVLKEIKE